MTDLMERPTDGRIDDGLGDRWEFEGFGVRLDVFPRPLSPTRLRFEFRVTPRGNCPGGSRTALYRNGEQFAVSASEEAVCDGVEVDCHWDVDV